MAIFFKWAFRAWSGLAIAGLACLLLARNLHYAFVGMPLLVERAVDRVIHLGFHTVILVSVLVPFEKVGAILLLLLFVVWRRLFLRRRDGRWGTRDWFHSLIWAVFLLAHFLVDLNPRVALACAASTLLLLPLPPDIGFFRTILWVSPIGLLAYSAITAADSVAILFFGVLLAVVGIAGRRFLAPRDRAWLLLAGGMGAQIVAAFIPLMLPRHGGRLLGTGQGYSFCENVERKLLFVTVTNCYDLTDECLTGHVVEFKTPLLLARRELHFFDESFYGRLMYPLCLPDSLRIGMAQTHVNGGRQHENVMDMAIGPGGADPTKLIRSVRGREVGQQIRWDRGRDALFYTSEFSNIIIREDLNTGAVDHDVGKRLIPDAEPDWIFYNTWMTGSLVNDQDDIDQERGKLYLGHEIVGSTIYEIDLARLEVTARYHPHHGMNSGITVDPGLRRLLVTSVWGVESVDLASARSLARVRLGFGTRTPVVDAVNDLVYVASNIEGRLWVLDRHTLEVLGVLPLGKGARTPYISTSQSKLFVPTERAYYWWDLAELARRFPHKTNHP